MCRTSCPLLARLCTNAISLTVFLCSALLVFCWDCQAQQSTSSDGFSRVEGKHISIVTDLPLDDDLRDLPRIFDQAIPTWCEKFFVAPKEVGNWKTTLYLMLDRNRFKEAGMIPKEVPEFPNGWQYGDDLWVVEQASPYYRRHLILHEGTHWFMFRKYGFYDTPWLAEGMAEILGTHRWKDGKLTMGIVPANREEVPFWGRIKIVRDQCAGGLAPSFEEILRYSKTAHQDVDAYAWSWALTLFLENHPDTAKVFDALLRQPAMNSREVERWLRARLAGKMPRIRSAWRAFVTELDYGYSMQPGLLQLTEQPSNITDAVELKIQANLGWQASKLAIKSGDSIKIMANGNFTVGSTSKPWTSTPAGVTLEYYRGQPLGKLLMTVIAPQSDEQPTELIDFIAVGSELTWTAKQDGEIFFKVNESAGKLSDNTGEITVKIDPQ